MERRSTSAVALTAARVAGVTSVGVLSFLLNPLVVASVVGVAALVAGRKARRRPSTVHGSANQRNL